MSYCSEDLGQTHRVEKQSSVLQGTVNNHFVALKVKGKDRKEEGEEKQREKKKKDEIN